MYSGKPGVHAMYMAKKKVTPHPKPQYRKTFIRAWRKHRGLTQVELAERVRERLGKMTHASVGRIENRKQPYSQPILEAFADELTNGDVASLLIRDPSDPEGIWSIWDQAKEAERREIVEHAKITIRKTGT